MGLQNFDKVIRVVSFEESTSEKLVDSINKWIISSSVEIVDIKYNVVLTQGFDGLIFGGISSYSALVLFKFINIQK